MLILPDMYLGLVVIDEAFYRRLQSNGISHRIF